MLSFQESEEKIYEKIFDDATDAAEFQDEYKEKGIQHFVDYGIGAEIGETTRGQWRKFLGGKVFSNGKTVERWEILERLRRD